MTVLTRPVRRLVQPNAPVEIDWANPLTRGLVAVQHVGGSVWLRRGNPIPITISSGTPTRILNTKGVALIHSAQFSYALTRIAEPSVSAYTGPVTMVSVIIPGATGTQNTPSVMGGGSGHQIFGAFGGVAGKITAFVRAVGDIGGSVTLTDVLSPATVVVRVIPGVESAMWLNGRKDPVTLSGTPSSLPNGELGTDVARAGVMLNAYFLRAMSDFEISQISANPYLLFKPVQQRVAYEMLAGGATLQPPLLTNNQTFYSPTVTGGAVPQILAPGLLNNSQTFYAPSVDVVGFTAAYVLANTAATGGNVEGFMYDIAGLVDPGDYMTYTTVSGPTPGGGTLDDSARDGSFTYTGGAPAIWVVQVKINGVDYFETTTVYLYDQDSTLFPPLLTNGQTFYAPTVTGGGPLSLLPPLLTNTQTFYRPTITGGIPAPDTASGRYSSMVAEQIVQPICRPIVRPMT